MHSFLKIKQGRKVFATLVVGAFFLFFWINGPLHLKEVLAHLEVEKTAYSESKIVGEEKQIRYFNAIGDAETHGEGWGLLLHNKRKNKTHGLIALSQKNGQHTQEREEQLKRHVESLFTVPISIQVLKASFGVYLAIEANKKTSNIPRNRTQFKPHKRLWRSHTIRRFNKRRRNNSTRSTRFFQRNRKLLEPNCQQRVLSGF